MSPPINQQNNKLGEKLQQVRFYAPNLLDVSNRITNHDDRHSLLIQILESAITFSEHNIESNKKTLEGGLLLELAKEFGIPEPLVIRAITDLQRLNVSNTEQSLALIVEELAYAITRPCGAAVYEFKSLKRQPILPTDKLPPPGSKSRRILDLCSGPDACILLPSIITDKLHLIVLDRSPLLKGYLQGIIDDMQTYDVTLGEELKSRVTTRHCDASLHESAPGSLWSIRSKNSSGYLGDPLAKQVLLRNASAVVPGGNIQFQTIYSYAAERAETARFIHSVGRELLSQGWSIENGLYDLPSNGISMARRSVFFTKGESGSPPLSLETMCEAFYYSAFTEPE